MLPVRQYTLLGEDAASTWVKTAVAASTASTCDGLDGNHLRGRRADQPAGACLSPRRRRPLQEAAAGDLDKDLGFVPIKRDRPAAPEGDAARASVLARVDFVFRPMWDPMRNVIATYLCVPRVKLLDSDDAMSDATLAVAGDSDAAARLDSITIARVKEEVEAMAAGFRHAHSFPRRCAPPPGAVVAPPRSAPFRSR